MENNNELQKLKQQIIFSQMPISEKDFWLLLIKNLSDEDIPAIKEVLEKYKASNANKTKLIDLKNQKNKIVKKYNDEIIAKIKKKLDNMIKGELNKQDQQELENIRNYFNNITNHGK